MNYYARTTKKARRHSPRRGLEAAPAAHLPEYVSLDFFNRPQACFRRHNFVLKCFALRERRTHFFAAAMAAILYARGAAAAPATMPAPAVQLTAAHATQQSPATQPAPDASAGHVDDLITQLGADDPVARQAAATELLRIAAPPASPARAALREATQSDDPETRGQATAVLLQLPFTLPGDPPPVADALNGYGALDADGRKLAIAKLGDLPDSLGTPALQRLAFDEPSDDVRWAVVSQLRDENDPAQDAALRKLLPSPDSSPLMALAGWAWRSRDPDRAIGFFKQALATEQSRPTDDDGEFAFVFDALVDDAIAGKRYDDAADLLRQEIARGGPTDETGAPEALFDLFALHGDFGPLKHFEDDKKLAADRLGNRKIQYALAHVLSRTGPRAAAKAADDAAFAAGLGRADRYLVGSFLAEHGWNEDAERELQAVLAMSSNPQINAAGPQANGPAQPNGPAGANGPANPNGQANANNPTAMDMLVSDANVLFRLSHLAALRGDDFQAAERERVALESISAEERQSLFDQVGHGHERLVPEPEVWSDVHWHYLRNARKRHNAAEVTAHLNELVRLQPSDEEILCDIVPILKDQHRAAETDALFEAAYAREKKNLDADPADPHEMNNLAWLCARCGEHLPEALSLAKGAVAAMPNESSFLDTLAEATFRNGDAPEAARLETRALEIEPGDVFMTKQLKRFKGETTEVPLP